MMGGLGKRITTAAILLPLVILAVWAGPVPLAILLSVAALLGGRELARLGRNRGLTVPYLVPGLLAALVILCWARLVPLEPAPALVLVAVAAILLELFRPGGSVLLGSPLIAFGALYLGLLPAHLLGYYDFASGGESVAGAIGRDPWPLYYVFLLVWTCDTAAFLAGSAIGRHKLWPRVSPKKSWEGSIAALLGSIVAALLAGGWVPGLDTAGRIGAGVLAAVFSQIGDLAESWMKREAAVKDSGRSFPGHGGMLDRLDSLVLTIPVLYYWLRWSLHGQG
ncbi:MAG: phosphatidate cytidylyltransferase [Candidatus Eisenbacteria bacterium]|nr:phosphatidate cytidylyltransferase [Candidatus Eisenbacteria bacterium]